MIELIYASTRPSTTTDRVVVDDIVLPAMRFNREHDITGCLWFGPSRFLQILEGDAADVTPLYERIQRDPRHTDVRLIHTAPIAARSFVRWSMNLIKSDETNEVESLIAAHAPTPRHVPPVPSTTSTEHLADALRSRLLALIAAHA